MEEDGIWVTINGAHVFIKEGQSPMDAFIKQKGGTKEKDEIDLSYQGKGSEKAPISGKTADVIINEVRKWEEQGKNSVLIEQNKEAIDVLKRIEGKPNEKIKIYRATPGDRINDGDWVFIDKQHADRWTKTPLGTPKPGFKVVEMEVMAKDVEWTRKNLEFAYRKPKN